MKGRFRSILSPPGRDSSWARRPEFTSLPRPAETPGGDGDIAARICRFHLGGLCALAWEKRMGYSPPMILQEPLSPGALGRRPCVRLPRSLGSGPRSPEFSIPSSLRAKSAHQVDDEAYQQDQANPTAADDGPSEVKAAAAEQEKKHDYEE